MHPCIECGVQTTNPQFCSLSCSARHNNKLRHKTTAYRTCYICHLSLPLESFCKRKDKPDGREYRCHHCVNKSKRAINEQVRIEALIHYGGKCACCGFDDLNKKICHMSFLHFDHINGGGRTHANSVKSSRWLSRWLKRNNYPAGFRVLCAPCNIAMLPGDSMCELHKWELEQQNLFKPIEALAQA